MPAPLPSNSGVTRGHPVYVIFTGSGTLKSSLVDYGIFFDTEVEDDTMHCMLIDPRFSRGDVESYIVELGGVVYEREETPGENN